MSTSEETRPFIPLRKKSGSDIEIREDVHFNAFKSRLRLSSQRRKRRVLLGFVVVVFVAILAGLLYYYFSRKVQEYEEIISEETQEIEVNVQGGFVRGTYEGNSVAFKGIPFAIPPVGNLRWKAPVPCDASKCWNGTFDAGEFGSMCTQRDTSNGTDPTRVVGSENCLFVNVWTPKKRPTSNLLPVLIYVHGGFLLYGSGNWNGLYPSAQLVSELKIVGVSFNYRLNAFGFLALKSLADGSPSKTSGNYGFMDQILVLQWVKANIEKFGGDPRSVTLMGHSSGATSELALLTSPRAAGLFHGAILMSGSPIFNKTSEDASRDNEVFVKNANCVRNSSSAELECLYSLSPMNIEDSIPWDVYPYWQMADQDDLPTKNLFDGAVAVVDGLVVPNPPLLAMATGQGNDVPIIVGTTAQEINYHPVKNFENSTLAAFSAYVKEKLFPFIGVNFRKVLVMYNKTLPDGSSPSLQFSYTSMASDLRMTCPNNVLAVNASRGFESPVYRYIVTNSPTEPVKLMGFPATFAFHMWDLIAFFGFPKGFNYLPSKKDLSFMMDLRIQFNSFIHNKTFKTWNEYPQNTALFTDSGMKFLDQDGYHKRECDFWLDNGFFSYAWIN